METTVWMRLLKFWYGRSRRNKVALLISPFGTYMIMWFISWVIEYYLHPSPRFSYFQYLVSTLGEPWAFVKLTYLVGLVLFALYIFHPSLSGSAWERRIVDRSADTAPGFPLLSIVLSFIMFLAFGPVGLLKILEIGFEFLQPLL